MKLFKIRYIHFFLSKISIGCQKEKKSANTFKHDNDLLLWTIDHLLTFIYFVFQEKRIYDLKKKNQELEKFKFVLDYKIKELKKQIEPRENDIKAMKEQIQEVGFHFPSKTDGFLTKII